MSISTSELEQFRLRHKLRCPKFIGSDNEAIQLQKEDGLRLLKTAPTTDVQFGNPPRSNADIMSPRYLWVIDIKGIPYIWETPVPIIGIALPKHTNLTGGNEAYLGGEMWFISETSIYISGGSGRYPPESNEQLEEAGRVFESFNYEVAVLGWDYEVGAAKRYLEG